MAKLSPALRRDIGLDKPAAPPSPTSLDIRLDRLGKLLTMLTESAEKTAGAAILQAVRQEQMAQALKVIGSNTVRRPWSFPVTRDKDGRITSIRAIPEGE